MLIGARGTPTNKSAERHAAPAHFILFFVILIILLSKLFDIAFLR